MSTARPAHWSSLPDRSNIRLSQPCGLNAERTTRSRRLCHSCCDVWFVLLGAALLLVAVGGIYFRRRTLGALALFGVSSRARRITGLAILWLLFGLPVLVFFYVLLSIALGRDSFSIETTGIWEWLLVFPFWFSVLVMLQSLPYFLLFDLAYLAARKRLERSRLRRYRAVACLVTIALLCVYTPTRILIERGVLDVNHYQIGSPESGPALRIAFFADLQQDHHTDSARADEVVSLINDNDPDIVLVGGDWINTGSDHIEAAAAAGSKLKSRLGTFSVRGDHEHFAYRDGNRSVSEVSAALERHGVNMLHNQVRTIEHNDKQIALIYLSYNYIVRTPHSEIRALIREAQTADYSILITHQFDSSLAAIVADKVDLALIAHTHGGQVNPLVGFVHVPIARVETPYLAGRYQLGSTTLIVTAGIGYSIAPFRYASPATIEIIDLHI